MVLLHSLDKFFQLWLDALGPAQCLSFTFSSWHGYGAGKVATPYRGTLQNCNITAGCGGCLIHGEDRRVPLYCTVALTFSYYVRYEVLTRCKNLVCKNVLLRRRLRRWWDRRNKDSRFPHFTSDARYWGYLTFTEFLMPMPYSSSKKALADAILS